ncbi:MAG: hypothetical protein MR224_02835, partial [Dorea sp.]|nr:hypothetical protein [Dorea sp.]
MASKQELLESIQPGMKLTKNFFMKIYGYELTWTGFADQALSDLEKAGCSKARVYYRQFVGEYEKQHDEEMKEVADWYRKQLKGDGKDWKRQREAELRKEDLQQKSDRELL